MKKIKRFLSMAIGLVMLVSALSGMTVASAVELEVYDPNYDFVRDGYLNNNSDAVETLDSYDGRSNVIHIKENNGNTSVGAVVSDETLATDKYNFSFDFKSSTYQAGTSTGPFAYITVSTKAATSDIFTGWAPFSFGTKSTGSMGLCFVNATEYDSTYGYKENCQNDVWYHIDCIYDYSNQKIQIYCDGEKISERAMYEGGETANAFFVTSRQSSGSKGAKGDVYFSNLKVNALGKQTITAEYDAANTTDSRIAVRFSEAVAQESLNAIKIVDSETLKPVSTGGVTKTDGLTAAIPVSGLKYGAEYRISVPEGITGALGGITAAQEICFNTADVKGTFSSHVFEDNFESYEAMKNAGSADTGNLNEIWPRSGSQYWGFGRYVWTNGNSKVLRIDGWQATNAVSVKTVKSFESAYTDGIIEYNFDMAVNDQNSDEIREFSFVLKRGDTSNYDQVFAITGDKITLCNPISASTTPQVVTNFNMPNNLTDMVSFKVIEDLINKKVKTYVKQNGEYVLLNNDPNGAAIANYHYTNGGTSAFGFQFYKGATSNVLATDTSMIIDNITVDVGEPPMSAVVKKLRLDDGELTSKSASAATTDIKVYFNQDMDATTLDSISVSAADGSAVDKDVTYNADTCCAMLKLKGMLRAKTAYTINVPTTVKTADGRALAREYAGVFTTGEGTLFVSNPTLKNGDVDATKENTKAGNTLTAKVSVINQTGSSDDLVLILAAYDGDKLIDLKYDPKAYTAADTNFELTTTYTIPENVGDLNVQVMLWNGFNRMMPVKGAITLE